MTREAITTALQGRVLATGDSFGMLVLAVAREDLAGVVRELRDAFGFALFLDVTAVDRPTRSPRFTAVYHFLRPRPLARVRLTVDVHEDDPVLPTLTGLYGSARYMEREVHDMYGLRFDGNDDLRPILLYEGFEGHPLRKDYAMEREQPIVEYRREPSLEGRPAEPADPRQPATPGAATPHPAPGASPRGEARSR